MTKAELVASLDGIKNMTSVVSIESMLEMLEAMEPEVVEAPVALSQELIEDILNRIERRLENESTNLVDMDSIELSLDYRNHLEIDSAGIDVYSIMQEIESVLDNINEDRAAEALSDEDEDEDMTFAREEDDTLNGPSFPEALIDPLFIETCDDAGEKIIVRFEDHNGGLGGTMDNEMS